MAKTKTYTNCLKCPHHQIVPDPDPTDSFNNDDIAVLCTKIKTTKTSAKRWYDGKPFPFHAVSVSDRPYIRKVSPSYLCPLVKK